jgi:hypothetical protein
MKIDTKKTTPVKGSQVCKIAENPYILVSKNGEAKEDEDYGRQLTFIPTVFFTPVLTSKRSQPSPSRVSDADMEDLSVRISKMFISKEVDTKKEPKEEEEEVKNKNKWVVLDAKDKPLAEPLGRYEVEVVTSSNALVRVMRSLRLI